MSVIVSGSVTVSGSTEIGYKLNITNLILAYDAGSEDSFPPSPNTTIYDLSGNLNNTTLPATVTYENISSSFFFTSSIADSAIPFIASELSTANFATFETVIKLKGDLSSTLRTIYGFNNYSLAQQGNQISFATWLGGRYIAAAPFTTDNNWTHIVAEMHISASDPVANNKIWINGVSQSLTSTFDNGDINDCDFNGGVGRIGLPVLDDVQIRMHGYIPVFKIYNRTLSQQEITNNYNFYKSRYSIP